jgi:hypothetical protein
VADDHPVPNDFTGETNWVEIDVAEAAQDADHQLDHDELLAPSWPKVTFGQARAARSAPGRLRLTGP